MKTRLTENIRNSIPFTSRMRKLPISLFFPVPVMMLMSLICVSMPTSALATSKITSMNTTITANASFLDGIEMKKVRVGNIDISYKIFGKGEPLLLIPGFSMTMDMWEPNGLQKLSSNHTIIIFDNRGIGNIIVGNKAPSIQLFANDTTGLIDAVGIQEPVDILGISMGGFIAQELTLLHPEKVNSLIIYSSSCGGKDAVTPQLTSE